MKKDYKYEYAWIVQRGKERNTRMNAELGEEWPRAGETTQWLKPPAVLPEDLSHHWVKAGTAQYTPPSQLTSLLRLPPGCKSHPLAPFRMGVLSLFTHHTYYLNLNLNKHTYKIFLNSFSLYAYHQFLCSDPPHLNNSISFLDCLPYFLPLRSNPFSILLRELLFMDITRLSWNLKWTIL